MVWYSIVWYGIVYAALVIATTMSLACPVVDLWSAMTDVRIVYSIVRYSMGWFCMVYDGVV